MAGDKAGLAKALAGALGWDPPSVEPIVEAIAGAQSQQDLDELVQGYLGGGEDVRELVAKFLGKGKRGPITLSDAKGRQHKPGQRQAGSVMIRHVPGRQGGAGAGASTEPVREVANCLACGKIYFPQADDGDTREFVSSGGVCTFCGARVALHPGEVSQTRPLQGDAPAQDAAAGGSGAPGASGAAAEAEARALKDRLVEYDRNARQRTTVVDDQNDFFEIDANAWLDPEEREQLKRQERALRQAEEARQRRVTVTLDLLGRKVLLADEPEQPSVDSELRSAAASLAAARATAAEAPRRGGAAAAAAGAGARIQPSGSALGERPLFVPHADQLPDRRLRLTSDTPKQAAEDAPQGVVGGWGGEQSASGYSRDRLGRAVAARAEPRGYKGPSSSRPAQEAVGQPEGAAKPGGGRRQRRREASRRLQHDDPIKGIEAEGMQEQAVA